MRSLTGLGALMLAAIPFNALHADPLPFRDGVYLSQPELCGLSISEMTNRIGDEVHYIYQEIDGAVFRGAEAQCDIGDVSISGDRVRFQASCDMEGMINRETIELTYVSESTFQSGGAVFQRCG
jgi:hypothetical protein